MKRELGKLTGEPIDLLVVGGGIFAVCAAWDAAQRGLSVALIERHDFGGATSANSFKVVHGGIRYLQHADLYRIRQSSNERRVLLTIAPHLVHPLPIVIPTFGWGMKGKAALRIGIGIYDVLTCDRNRGISDPTHHIPWGQFIDRQETLRRFPGLRNAGLTGAAIFSDAQMFNPPRLVLAFLKNAVNAGAVVANYVEATGLLRDGDTVKGVRARDTLTGADMEIHARVVLNAAGPYAESWLSRTAGLALSPPGVYSRDACFVVPRRLTDGRHALAIQGATHDPDAKFSRGERHIFIAPWRHYTLVGTWHVVHKDDPDQFTVTDHELENFIGEVNAAYPGLKLCLDDVSIWNAGLVPFGDNPEGARHLRYGHRSRLIDHAKTHRLQNLVTLIGVRFTTGRIEAVHAVDLVYRKLGRSPPKSRTHSTAVCGGEFDNLEELRGQAEQKWGRVLGADVIQNLVYNYGTEYARVLRTAVDETDAGKRLGSHATIQAQVRYAAREEMAQKLGDVVFRRTDLGTGEFPGLPALEQCAQILGKELGWQPGRKEREIEEVTGRFPYRHRTKALSLP